MESFGLINCLLSSNVVNIEATDSSFQVDTKGRVNLLLSRKYSLVVCHFFSTCLVQKEAKIPTSCGNTSFRNPQTLPGFPKRLLKPSAYRHYSLIPDAPMEH